MDDPTDAARPTTAEIEEQLRAEPWLRPHLRVGDGDLEPARERFAIEQALAVRELHRAGVDVAVRVHHGAMLTTAFDTAKVSGTKR